MKILKIILITIVSITLLLLIISFFLPSKFHTQRSLVMKAKPEQVYKLVNNFRNWDLWGPWNKMDTTALKSYNDITEGTGAAYSWKSKVDEVGEGTLTIIEAVTNQKIRTEMQYKGMGYSYSDIIIEPGDSGIKVTWSMDTEGKGIPVLMKPLWKMMCLMMDRFVGPNYEKGLKNIKEIVENEPIQTIAGFESEIKEWPAFYYVGIREKLKGAEISQKFGTYIGLLMAEMKKQGVEQAGNPFSINYSASGDLFDIEICIPVKQPIVENAQIKPGSKLATQALVIQYYGDYMNIGKVYGPGFEYLAKNNLNASGAPMEFYVTDPIIEKDTAKWLTEVVLPCQ
ncbi:MAG: SRPBCC family protein [Bacteroidota bacterium]|nr:SRPBCC family protein [Bacteroidota bacterium]